MCHLAPGIHSVGTITNVECMHRARVFNPVGGMNASRRLGWQYRFINTVGYALAYTLNALARITFSFLTFESDEFN
jgi:hypothetical protein